MVTIGNRRNERNSKKMGKQACLLPKLDVESSNPFARFDARR